MINPQVSQAYSSNNNVSSYDPQYNEGQFFPGDESHVFSSNPVPVNINRQQGKLDQILFIAKAKGATFAFLQFAKKSLPV